jgi:hypothetical protein
MNPPLWERMLCRWVLLPLVIIGLSPVLLIMLVIWGAGYAASYVMTLAHHLRLARPTV